MTETEPWRFVFGFVPWTPVTRHWALGDHPIKVRDADREGLWNGTAVISLVESLDTLGVDSRMVSASQLRWGAENENCITVFVEGERVTNISVTLDLRVPCLKFVSDLTLVANRQDWLVITTDGRIFRPTVRRFLVEMQQSPGMRWIQGSMDAFARRQSTTAQPGLRGAASLTRGATSG